MDGTIEGKITLIADLPVKYFGEGEERKTKESKKFFVQRGKELIGFELNRWSRFADELSLIEGFHEGDNVVVQYTVVGSKLYYNKDGEPSNFTRLKVLHVELQSDELFEHTPKTPGAKRKKKEVDIPAYSGHLGPLTDADFAEPEPPKPQSKPLFDDEGNIDDSLPF